MTSDTHLNPGDQPLYPENTIPGDDIDLRHLLMMLWRRRLMIIIIVLGGIGLSTLAVNMVQPLYKAKALVLLETTAPPTLQHTPKNMLTTSPADTAVILSELEVLRSRSMAALVIEKLGMADNKQQNSQQSKSFRQLAVQGSTLKTLPPDMINPEISHKVTRFQKALNVRVLPGSSALQIEFTASDPARAALVVNALIETYIAQRSERQYEANQKLTSWLDRHLKELRHTLHEKESEIERYKVHYGLIEDSAMTLSDDQLTALYEELAKARMDKARIEAKLNYAQALKTGNADIESSSEILNSTLINSLKIEAVRLEGAISELSQRYGEKHPKMIKSRAELHDLQRAINEEINTITTATKNDLALAQAHIESLESSLNEVKGQRYQDSAAMIGLRELERDTAATRAALENVLQSAHYEEQKYTHQGEQARIISAATAPLYPSSPNKKLIISLSAFLSLFLALGLVLLLEKLDNAFRSARQLETKFGYPCYGLLPMLPKTNKPQTAAYPVHNPASIAAEAVRTLRMLIKLRTVGANKPKVVAVTSSFPGEGKTTLSLWMGRLAAKSGEKVIVIDTDLRRPNVHKSLGTDNKASIIEYLTGKKALADIINKDALSGADMIFARSVPANALDLIGSGRMQALVEKLREEYDLVILDTPACLAVSDARLIASMADQTLYAVAWNSTPCEAVATGIKQFTDMRYEPLAFVLTNVDVKKHVRYGYGDTVYYYGRYGEEVSK